MKLNTSTMGFLAENICELMSEATIDKNPHRLDKKCDIIQAIAITLRLEDQLNAEEFDSIVTFAADLYCNAMISR